MKKNPIGIRFNQEKLDFVRQKYPELKTPQQVVNFLLNAFWWQHHAAVFQNGVARVPADSPIADTLRSLDRKTKQAEAPKDEAAEFAFVEERRKAIPETTKKKVKEAFDRIDAEAAETSLSPIPLLSKEIIALQHPCLPHDSPEEGYTEKEKAMVAEFNRSVDEEIAAIRKESVPAHLNTLWGKKNWKLEQQKRIEKLEASKL